MQNRIREKIYDLMGEILSKRDSGVMYHFDPVKRQEEIEDALITFAKSKEEKIAMSKFKKLQNLTDDELKAVMNYFKRLQKWSEKWGESNE